MKKQKLITVLLPLENPKTKKTKYIRIKLKD